MTHASLEQAQNYLQQHPELGTLELLSPDMNGMLRAKRIPRAEIETFFSKGLTGPGTTPIMNSLGDCCVPLGLGTLDGDPDKSLHPVAGSLAPIPWLQSATHQVLVDWTELDGAPLWWNSRTVLANALQPLTDLGLKVVVATELEFYLLHDGSGPTPKPRLGKILGTNLEQGGTQYCNPEDMAEFDGFLEAVRLACISQDIPATTAHLEFAPGQFEINLHHVDDVVTACDHAVLLKRLIKGVAASQGMGATFMAKPFADQPGNGLHIHISVYDGEGNNIFVDAASEATPPVNDTMRHAIGGLGALMGDCQAMFAPNANSYRRLQPGCYAPLSPNWGYNHRNVSLRIPVSNANNLRVEHRVAGADANPYLVLASVLAGIHYGITEQCDPGPFIDEGTLMEDEQITLATNWPRALDNFAASERLPLYFGEQYCKLFETIRRDEYNQFNAVVSNVDYEWYLRSV
ncbi:MAG: glutamine synthetase family protein [Halieaceae bacterium]